MITIKKYEEKYKSDLYRFYLDSEDGKYTALPKQTLEMTLMNPNKTAIVILIIAVIFMM